MDYAIVSLSTCKNIFDILSALYQAIIQDEQSGPFGIILWGISFFLIIYLTYRILSKKVGIPRKIIWGIPILLLYIFGLYIAFRTGLSVLGIPTIPIGESSIGVCAIRDRFEYNLYYNLFFIFQWLFIIILALINKFTRRIEISSSISE